MAFRMGHCPQCDAQILVQDTNGVWNSRMPNWRQADLVFENTKVRIPICVNCFGNPDFEKILTAIVGEGSFVNEQTRGWLEELIFDKDEQLIASNKFKNLPKGIEMKV